MPAGQIGQDNSGRCIRQVHAAKGADVVHLLNLRMRMRYLNQCRMIFNLSAQEKD